MHKYEVGTPYIPGKTSWTETGEYNCRSGAHELRLFFRNLRDQEIAAVASGEAKFSLAVVDDIIFMLYKIGDAFQWSDAPYTWHTLPESERDLPPALAASEKMLLTVVLVEASNGIVKALRLVSMPHDFSLKLNAAIRKQADMPFDQKQYDQHLASIYARFNTGELRRRYSIARFGLLGGSS